MKDEALKLALAYIQEVDYGPYDSKPVITAIKQALVAQPAPVQEPVALEEYDAGLLNDYGGGNVEWWQDYIRAELGRAYEHYQSQITTPPAQPAPVQPVAHIVGEIDHTGKVWKPVQPAPVPIKPIVDPGLDVNQRLAFKLGWKSAEEAHGITKGQP
jgi:hypothetical protein